jgi:2-oxo-3-hexenedioate decarboxylase/2-keto-4-pentenoate hydratase
MEAAARERAVALLRANRIRPGRLALLPEDCRPPDETSAYDLQDALHEALTGAGFGPLVGYKIGCTTPVMQRFLEIDHPCAGGLFESRLRRQEGIFPHGDFNRVGVECEIAVQLADDLPAEGAPYGRAEAGAAVGAVMAAIEVVDDRYRDYRTFDLASLIADDFFNAAAVVGPPVTDWRGLDLAALEGRMTLDGREAGRGRGADILGHPLEALAWLANALAARVRGLAAGSLVLLGSVVETQWPAAGQTVEIEIEGLGGATAVFPG